MSSIDHIFYLVASYERSMDEGEAYEESMRYLRSAPEASRRIVRLFSMRRQLTNVVYLRYRNDYKQLSREGL